jgi:hypothetical protein
MPTQDYKNFTGITSVSTKYIIQWILCMSGDISFKSKSNQDSRCVTQTSHTLPREASAKDEENFYDTLVLTFYNPLIL